MIPMFRFEQYVSGEILKLVLILAQFRLAKRLTYIYTFRRNSNSFVDELLDKRGS